MELFFVFIKEFITLFSEMAPFLLLGFLLAGILHVWVPNRIYVPKVSKSNFSSVLWAALFGVPLPICSCGVIPTSIAMRREGASKGACVSFLISTPATGIDSIMATYSLLGLPFALLRPVVAFVTAMLGGVLTNFATRNEATNSAVMQKKSVHDEKIQKSHCCNHDECCNCTDEQNNIQDCCSCESNKQDHCCCESSKEKTHKRTLVDKIKETFRYGLVDMVGDVSKWLVIGLLLGAMISAFVPNEFFFALREYPILCMLCVLLLAMPMYTCATGSIPLALALVAKGITPGAALVLLMAGPATSIASMLVVGKAFGKRTLVAYLFSVAFGTMIFGFIVDTFFMDTFLSTMLPQNLLECHGQVTLGFFDYICAGLLAILIVYSRVVRNSNDAHCCCECNDSNTSAHKSEKCY